jgi:hypothetical protein
MIEHGHVTEVGPHRQLMKQNGVYARLYRAQFEMFGKPDSEDSRPIVKTASLLAGEKFSS